MPNGYLFLVLHAHLPYVRHPEYDRFRALRREFDPKGRFMNAYLWTLFPY